MTTHALTADSTLGQLCYIRFARVLTCRFYLSFPHSVSFLLSLSCFRRGLTDPSSLGFALRMIYPHNPVNSQHHSRASAPTTEPCPPFRGYFRWHAFCSYFEFRLYGLVFLIRPLSIFTHYPGRSKGFSLMSVLQSPVA